MSLFFMNFQLELFEDSSDSKLGNVTGFRIPIQNWIWYMDIKTWDVLGTVSLYYFQQILPIILCL